MSRRSPRDRFVSASELGKVVFCPKAYYLDLNRKEEQTKSSARGERMHQELAKTVKREQSLLLRFWRWLVRLCGGGQ
ncbi:hypothetical protein A6E01_19105 (plasmid) [Vibrio breoganii]|uniref:Uncharacterized protein n=1 Tax=Vibrio breoganii TaxID=553239 RepID=A0AAN0XZA7_9VIBR|nr:hypothetical protein [Vibrio breoganii]ANO35323.1 hypothetical protein A6E01_19105 [Vibrio breoganii]PML12755.1 hypothetical protein BCT84_02400 [Vibrio breoganii]